MKLKQLLLGLLTVTAMCSAYAQTDSLADGRSGRIEFQSITPPDRWQFVRKNLENTKTVTVFGELLMPKRINGKVPAVLISHDSGGVTPKLYDPWAKELNNAGIAVFIVDSFKPRGIDSTTNDQGQVDVSANVADALYGLKLLATHPQIDAKRIFHMGGSRGGTAVFETYWDMVRKAVITDDLKFAGHIPLYQGNCNTRFRFDRGNTNKAPMLALMGASDDGTPADACVAYYTELNQAGANIKWKIYPDTFHGFDGTAAKTYLPQGVTAKSCSIEVFITNVRGGGLGDARDYKTGAVINGFGEWGKAFGACNGRGYTVAANPSARDQAVKDVLAFINSSNPSAPKPTVEYGVGRPERIQFQSINVPSIWQFARKNTNETTQQTVWGDLLVPTGSKDSKVPALVIMHGSAGVESWAYDLWAARMNPAGVAVFVVDSFKPRGVESTATNQFEKKVSTAAQTADALNALRVLASHPQIDASHIYVIGMSRGTNPAFFSAWPMYQAPVNTNGAKFAGHILLYPAVCNIRYRADADAKATAPIYFALADREREDYGDTAICERYARELAASGNAVTFKEYPGTYHAWDGGTRRFRYEPAHTGKACDMELQMTPVAGSGLGRNARDFKNNRDLKTFEEWDAAINGCMVMNPRARVGGDAPQTDAVVADVLKFLKVR